jgi:hypothetical protein
VNTWLEDVAQVIGYSATARLAGWFGGSNLYIPKEASEDHTLAKLLGVPVLRRLVDEYGGETIPIPIDVVRDDARRDRVILAMFTKGVSIRDVAIWSNLSTRQVTGIKASLIKQGLLASNTVLEPTPKVECKRVPA